MSSTVASRINANTATCSLQIHFRTCRDLHRPTCNKSALFDLFYCFRSTHIYIRFAHNAVLPSHPFHSLQHTVDGQPTSLFVKAPTLVRNNRVSVFVFPFRSLCSYIRSLFTNRTCEPINSGKHHSTFFPVATLPISPFLSTFHDVPLLTRSRIMRPSHQNPLLTVALTILLIFIQLLTFTDAQTPAIPPSPIADIKPYAQGRIFSASTTSPISRTLSRNPELIESTASLVEYLEAAATTVSNTIANNHAQTPRRNSNRTIPICNNRSIPWRSATINFGQHRGWPVDPSARCITDIYGAGEVSGLTDEKLGALMFRRGLAQHNLRDDIIAEAGLSNWTRSGELRQATFQRGSQRCTLDSLGGVRTAGLWYTPTGITNRPMDEWLPSGEREYLIENVRVEGNKLVAALMTLPVNPVTGTLHKVETKSTTVLSRWGGAVEPSQFLPATIEENAALADALDKGQHFLQQVEDATTGSNVAILALPLVLSVIPFGLVTDITQKRMLVYALLSDVVTALPMFIKGVELVEISEKRFTSSVSRVGDMSVNEDITVVCEVWVASCGSSDNVAATGVSFIVLALLSMIAGMLLEVYVRVRQGSKKSREVGQYDVELEEFDDETDEWIGVSLEKQK